MKRVAFALAISGVLLLASWVQAPAAPSRDIIAPPAADVQAAEQTSQAVVPVARQIDQEAARLRQHLAAQPPFSEPARDPFRFSGKEKGKGKGSEPFSTVSREKGSDPLVLKTPASPPIAVPSLIALTADATDGGVIRTAVLSVDDEMAVVKPGQTFGRFIVQAIGPASVELLDITSQARTVFLITIR